jgi:hypothetical protein
MLRRNEKVCSDAELACLLILSKSNNRINIINRNYELFGF